MQILFVNEVFVSLQGEGHFTGTPAIFVRLQGCDVHCPWCDTGYAMSLARDLRTKDNWLPFLVSPINWSSVYYFHGGHMGIMNSDTFETNLRFLLLASPTPYQRKHMAEYSDIIKHRTAPDDNGSRK